LGADPSNDLIASIEFATRTDDAPDPSSVLANFGDTIDNLVIADSRDMAKETRIRRGFPRAREIFGGNVIDGLALITQHIGMKDPGHLAVLREITLWRARDLPRENASLHVVSTSVGVSLVTLEGDVHGWHARVQAAKREPSPEGITAEAAQAFVSSNEFMAQRALVVGGSRGIGQAFASLLRAGGASVHVTKRSRTGEVESVVAGSPDRTCSYLDVLAQPFRLSHRIREFQPTLLIYWRKASRSVVSSLASAESIKVQN
jgi:hypothetical protein